MVKISVHQETNDPWLLDIWGDSKSRTVEGGSLEAIEKQNKRRRMRSGTMTKVKTIREEKIVLIFGKQKAGVIF